MQEARHIGQYRTEMNEDDWEKGADGYTWPPLWPSWDSLRVRFDGDASNSPSALRVPVAELLE